MQNTLVVPIRSVPAAEVAVRPAARLLFVDNIRVLLTVLVLLHHLMITYAGTGGWYYKEGLQDFPTTVVGALFCSTNQAFFMGLFLLISAYWVPGSYDRKGPSRFFLDRLIRLGIPLAIYSWVLNPIFVYLLYNRTSMSFWDFMGGNFLHGPLLGAGPTWFIETLLLFSLVYVIWRVVTKSSKPTTTLTSPIPSNLSIAFFALLLAVLAFLLRTVFVMDDFNFELLNLQIPFFVQYVALFIVGLFAYRRNWLAGLSDATGRLWLKLAGLLILAWMPLMLIIDAPSYPDLMKGGWHWQSLAYATWESYMCMAMSIGLIYLFRSRMNYQGSIAGFLSRNAYTAYLIHPFVLVPAALAVSAIPLYPLLKWALVGIVVVPLCFLLSDLVRRLPYTDRIL